ncbi:hypothetical protein [Bradyrhizobium elkanii]
MANQAGRLRRFKIRARGRFVTAPATRFREKENVIPGRCESIEPSGAQLRTENLEIPGLVLRTIPE